MLRLDTENVQFLRNMENRRLIDLDWSRGMPLHSAAILINTTGAVLMCLAVRRWHSHQWPLHIAQVDRFCMVLLCGILTLVTLSGTAWAQTEPFDNSDDDLDQLKGVALAIAAVGAGVVITSPIWAPRYLIENDGDGLARFQAYPYEEGGGFIRFKSDSASDSDSAGDLRPWSLQAMTDYGYDFDSTQRIGTKLHLDTTSRFGFDTEWAYYQKDIWGKSTADLTTGDFNIIYRFAQSQHAQWWAGTGVNCLYAESRQDWGYNFAYGADVFLGKPWIASGSLDYGKLGSDDLFHAQIIIGAHWHAMEALLGYDFLNTGDIEIESILIGLRCWF